MPEQFQKEHPEIPWKDTIAMRNLLIHQYFGIDLDEVRATACNDLAILQKTITKILK